jgi:hypothetical protein
MSVDVETLVPVVDENEKPVDLPEAEVKTDAPEDKPAQARDESGKFKAKDEPKEKGDTELAKSEPKTEAKEPPKQQEQKTIPLASHLQERAALKAELDAMKKELEALKNPPKAPEPPPEDPKAYADHQFSKAQEKLAALEKQTGQLSAQQQEQVFLGELATAEQAFIKTNPDYFEALDHLRTLSARQLQRMHPQATEQQIWAEVRRQELASAWHLRQAGKDPIATAYEIAKDYGYQRKAPALELPKVETPKALAPDLTLGSSGAVEGAETDVKDPFAEAFGELFGRRKAS